jgi:hypothetical protein
MIEVLAEFRAPWGRALRTLSAVSVGILLLVMALGLLTGPRHLLLWRIAMVGIPSIVGLGALPFIIRGYALTSRTIEVRRPFWTTTLPLAKLQRASCEADVLRGSLRLFGNGGLFSFTGLFWNRRLGRYRAFVTDPSRAVVLRYRDRTVVLSPHDPQAFVLRVSKLIAMQAA